MTMFEDGLKQEIREPMVGRTKPGTLTAWITEAANIERDLAQLKGASRSTPAHSSSASTTTTHTTTVSTTAKDPNAMDVDRATTVEERAKRRTEGKCFFCGLKGHIQRNCPTKPPKKEEKVAAATIESTTASIATVAPTVTPTVVPSVTNAPAVPTTMTVNAMANPFQAWFDYMQKYGPPTPTPPSGF